jgi:hypothetical protein
MGGMARRHALLSCQRLVNPSGLWVGAEQRLGYVGTGSVMVGQGSRGYWAAWGGKWAGEKRNAGRLRGER